MVLGRVDGDWLFAPTPTRATYLTADALTHKFRRLGRAAGVANPAPRRLRHGVATHLVDGGKLLKAPELSCTTTSLSRFPSCGSPGSARRR